MVKYLLFYEFFKIGLFTFGGGYGSLPFLYELVDKYNWFSSFELTQLIAISGLTPGPIGLNMATFAGFKTLGTMGSIITSFALVLPMILITTQVFRLYRTFKDNRFVQSILYVLRPTSCALITYVAAKLFYNLVMKNQFNILKFDFKGIILLIILFLMTFKFDKNPIVYMMVAAVFGVCCYYLGLIT